MDELLRLWEQQSARSKRSTPGSFAKTWRKPGQSKRLYRGRAILKSPDFAFLDFQKVDGDKLVPYEQIRCTGKEVYHYRSANNQIFILPDARAAAAASLPGRAVAVPVQHARRGSQAAL